MTRSVNGGAAQPLAENIEDMQIAYGIDIDNNGIVADDTWVSGEWFDDPSRNRTMTKLTGDKGNLGCKDNKGRPCI